MKKWTIIVENEFKAHSEPKIITISSIFLRNILIALSVFLFISLSIFTIAKFYHLEPNALYSLNAKKQMLLSSLEEKNNYIDSLIDQMESFIAFEKKLRTFSNLQPLSEDIRKLGIGGYEIEDKRIKNINGDIKKVLKNLDNRLYQINNIVEFETNNIKDAEINIKEQYNLLKHKPSIMPTYGWITSKFGYRIDPMSGKRHFHAGIDIANDPGTPIYAPADGKVIFVGVLSGYGNVLKIDHGYGYVTVYAHLKKILVRKGQTIKRHQKIALMGNSGKSTGPHLHYEVRIFNKKINPFGFIDRDTVIR